MDKGVKHDKDKLKWSLLMSFKSLKDVVRVLMFGARKYPSADNWKKVPDGKQRYKDALMRHVVAYMNGEKKDEETELSHLCHCVCCALFLMEIDNENILKERENKNG